jgi:hypothetical protein
MDENEQILYLFSSTNDTYIKDILDILFLPADSVYRFRYDLKWISNELDTNDKLAKAPKETLLVHAFMTEHENAGKIEYHIDELIPIRKATILESRIVGDFVVFLFKLGEYIRYSTTYSGAAQNPYHSQLHNITPSPSNISENIVSSKLAFLAAHQDFRSEKDSLTKDEQDSTVINWSNLITYIGRIEPHRKKKSVFLKLLSISNIANDESLQMSELSSNDYGFKMKGNTTYRVRILQRSFADIKTPFLLNIETDGEIIKSVKSDAMIQGKYDILDFLISSGDFNGTKNTALFIKPKEAPPNEELIASLVCSCSIKAVDYRVWIFAALIGAGIALSALTASSNDMNLKTYGPLIGAVLVGAVPYLMRH